MVSVCLPEFINCVLSKASCSLEIAPLATFETAPAPLALPALRFCKGAKGAAFGLDGLIWNDVALASLAAVLSCVRRLFIAKALLASGRALYPEVPIRACISL